MAEVEDLVDDIRRFIVANDPRPHYWFSGVTDDVETTLRTIHRLDPLHGRWIAVQADDPEMAQVVETKLIEEVGTDGSGSLAPPGALHVYAFLKDETTLP